MTASDILQYSSADAIEDSFSHVQQVFGTGKTRNIAFRKAQLKRLYSLVKENEARLCEALSKDLNKPYTEALTGDICPTLDECTYFLNNIDRLVQDEVVSPRLLTNYTGKNIIRRDPLGVVLIIGCWNYPLQIILIPLAGAIAAGNAAVIKPSEISMHTSALISELFTKYMDTSCYRVVNGGREETTALLNYEFNHIFYTGNSAVGKIVMAAAAKNLTPVTLELGGKSPAIITPDSDFSVVAKRICFGKFFNCGQTCIAVDYVLVPQAHADTLISHIRETITEWFGENPKESKDYSRIMNTRHFDRLVELIQKPHSGTLVIGGQSDRETRYIAPTVITNVKFTDQVLMSEEIFGPILPIVYYNTIDEAISLINKRPSPLALYMFTTDPNLTKRVLENTKSGGVCVNDCLVHQSEYALPFGGVGSSGMGNYHGDHSFQTFTHPRTIMIKKQTMETAMRIRYPPYTDRNNTILRLLIAGHPSINWIKAVKGPLKIITILVVILAIYLKRFA
ncbi:Aldehyde/histidinol dehydrogenase [Phycomyces nitens]|nr:Aldehyde/histidinol dehydrogenase [Phycomyces nitens]